MSQRQERSGGKNTIAIGLLTWIIWIFGGAAGINWNGHLSPSVWVGSVIILAVTIFTAACIGCYNLGRRHGR